MPQACALTRTWPRPGDGISRSTISKSPPAFGTCATFIFAICVRLSVSRCATAYSMQPKRWPVPMNFDWHFEAKSCCREFRSEAVPHSEGLAAFGTRLRRLGLRADRKDSYTGHPVL